ncbi:porin [Advenella sp. FME57]|uniref:Porin n=1 Tax=Advenella kashmirensis TaxID=310575 RepID=A0A356LC57_9BURK|nr:porin [Advenella sp. FME57]HBP28504.1 porin [Advenella kashmirensis]
MKKALQSIVLLGAATGVAQAATSVTLYGLVDGGIGYTKTKITQNEAKYTARGWAQERKVGMVNGILNGNRWGLKGTEDLGNGTSAIFQLESGFDLGTGESKQDGRLFGRKAIIGLTGDSWGTLTLGRQYNVADDVVSGIDPFGTGVLQAGVVDGAFGDSPSARMDNSIKYMTPDFGGFKFGIAYSGSHKKSSSEIDEKETEKRDTSNWLSTGLGFDNGPVSVGLSYDRFRTDIRNRGYKFDPLVGEEVPFDKKTKGTTHMWNLFGAYDFEVVKLHLGYGLIRGSVASSAVTEAKVGSIGLNGALAGFTTVMDPDSKFHGLNYTEANGFRQQSWMVGLSAPVSDTGTVLFSYQGNKSKNTNEDFDGIKGKLNIFSVGYVQGLSKRTRVYAAASYGVGKMKFDEKLGTGNVKLKSTLIGVGLQHRF